MRFLTRVIIKNFKSIAACDVELGDLTLLVGPNGSGKSNFLDALRFVSDALNTNLENAIRTRGGLGAILRGGLLGDGSKPVGSVPANLGVRLDFVLSDSPGHYSFEIASGREGSYEVVGEECLVGDPWFRTEYGKTVRSDTPGAVYFAGSARLFLPIAIPGGFEPVCQALAGMSVFSLDPARMRSNQSTDSGQHLWPDGANAASVLRHAERAGHKTRIIEYLSVIVPGIQDVDTWRIQESLELLRFHENVAGADRWFLPTNVSDGTLRTLGILLALFQDRPLVGIEEPEIALHPGAVAVLLDALREASENRQVIVTTHSPDLLDLVDVDSDCVLGVARSDQGTIIGPIEAGDRTVLRKGLYKPGELLRMEQLAPDRKPQNPEASKLFDMEPA